MGNAIFGNLGVTRDENGILQNEYGEIYGYVRVSTKEQKEDRQIDAMLDYDVNEKHIFVEHVSGKNFNRPAYKRLIRIVRKGDIIVIKSIDRLGRSYSDIIDQWRMITQDIGCGIHVIDMPTLNTSSDPADLLSRFITDMMLQVLSFVAENERENMLKHQKEGIEAARKRGAIKAGRPRVKIPFEFWDIYISWKTGEVKPKELLKYCKDKYDMCPRTFYRRIRELDMRYGDLSPQKLRNLIVEEDFADGIEFSMERCEAALGVYSSYTNNPDHEQELKKKRKSKEELEQIDEEDIRKIILQKRQADFREKFGIQSTEPPEVVKRGRKGISQQQRQALRDAEKATTAAIKTVIIN